MAKVKNPAPSPSGRKAQKIKYLDPASVEQIIEAHGSGSGILNTDRGLFLVTTGKTHPKGITVLVGPGTIKVLEDE